VKHGYGVHWDNDGSIYAGNLSDNKKKKKKKNPLIKKKEGHNNNKFCGKK
jgi:hypothetical protein